MTRRATTTQTKMERAIRAADKTGKVAVIAGDAIYFLAPDAIPTLPSPGQDEGPNTCDSAFGVSG
jgi:hypothetical protein